MLLAKFKKSGFKKEGLDDYLDPILLDNFKILLKESEEMKAINHKDIMTGKVLPDLEKGYALLKMQPIDLFEYECFDEISEEIKYGMMLLGETEDKMQDYFTNEVGKTILDYEALYNKNFEVDPYAYFAAYYLDFKQRNKESFSEDELNIYDLYASAINENDNTSSEEMGRDI